MNVRVVLLSMAGAVAIAAGVHHWKSSRAHTRFEAERLRIAAEAVEMSRLRDHAAREVASRRREFQALTDARLNRAAPSKPGNVTAELAGDDLSRKTKKPSAAAEPEVRGHQVQAFVSGQRLRFAALLKRLRFTPENLQEFDRIHGAYQQAVLDDAQTDLARRQAQETRDGQLRTLFGANYDQWEEANRDQPARAIVTQIVEQTFQSSGALTMEQANELTRIVVQHRVSSSPPTVTRQTLFDWDRIILEARSLLADQQMKDFIAAIEYRRASEKMSALASKRKP